ncbi:GntR family transcriptional regulator [Microbacterium ulmi]|uniref:GntR family transcriptional regulator n=1 Tax=Microbacterium ulmi TaxID=179095 RepID=A0A7Y2LYH8_9MICO|nr:GntR family transcriptional regulator [Microbacterium ulmi]NII69852.1 DNA-binding GntR family transcriptional regulator [Microbacterium ulmi]NNH03181.1 GntR family transcriptional regulator [Microbacterium ulmi]
MSDLMSVPATPEPGERAPLAGLGGQRRFAIAPVREGVADQIRSAILRLELKPGQRLIERELVEAMGVSRPTIREALQQLTAEGLVSTERGRGWLIHAPSYDEAADLYEIRARLEGMASRRFTERASEEHVRRLREAVEGLAELVEAGRPALELVSQKDKFYDVLFEGAGGDAIRQIVTGLQARITVLRSTTLNVSGRPALMVEEIRAIVSAAERRDADTAERACVRHVREAARVALGAMRAPAAPATDAAGAAPRP